jgi:hypothetical protein
MATQADEIAGCAAGFLTLNIGKGTVVGVSQWGRQRRRQPGARRFFARVGRQASESDAIIRTHVGIAVRKAESPCAIVGGVTWLASSISVKGGEGAVSLRTEQGPGVSSPALSMRAVIRSRYGAWRLYNSEHIIAVRVQLITEEPMQVVVAQAPRSSRARMNRNL